MGRPQLPEQDRRRTRHVRLSDIEHGKAEKAAAIRDVKVSSFMRESIVANAERIIKDAEEKENPADDTR